MKLFCHFIGSNVKKYYIQLQDYYSLPRTESLVSSKLTMLDVPIMALYKFRIIIIIIIIIIIKTIGQRTNVLN